MIKPSDIKIERFRTSSFGGRMLDQTTLRASIVLDAAAKVDDYEARMMLEGCLGALVENDLRRQIWYAIYPATQLREELDNLHGAIARDFAGQLGPRESRDALNRLFSFLDFPATTGAK